MYRFHTSIIRPLLELIQPSAIVEIGAEEGKHTKLLVQYCEPHNCTLHVIDPCIEWNSEDWPEIDESILKIHKSKSLQTLPSIEHYDIVLIDGDHNWYTVYHELLIIQKHAEESGTFPLVLVHDTGWPYGRRDMYFNLDDIPAVYRQPYAKKGLHPENIHLEESNGFNRDQWNAESEGGAQNGVLTAVEDFLRISRTPLRFLQITGMNGLGMLLPEELLNQNNQLADFMQKLTSATMLHPLLELIEKERALQVVHLNTADQSLKQMVSKQTLEEHLALFENKKKELEKEKKELESKLDELQDELQKESQKNSNLQTQLKLVHQHLHHMQQTRSWRWTILLRRAGKLLCFKRRKKLRKHHPITESSVHISGQKAVPIPPSIEEKGDAQKQKISHRPLISLVVAVNVFDEILLRRCLNSIVEQTYEEYELIIVNNGSSQTVLSTIIEDYKKEYPNKVLSVNISESQMRSSARNKGFAQASGDYVCFVRPTDTLEHTMLEKFVRNMQEVENQYDLLYCNHNEIKRIGKEPEEICKPAWSPERLLSHDYIGDVFLVKHAMLSKIGECDEHLKHSETHDLLLKLAEHQPSVLHVPEVLWHRHHRIDPSRESIEEGQRIVEQALLRRSIEGNVCQSPSGIQNHIPLYKINFTPKYPPRVSIIIPTKDRLDLLSTCINSIRTKTDYPNYNIIIIDNNSEEQETLNYLEQTTEKVVRIVTPSFNFSHINNEAARNTDAEYLLFMNNDIEVIDPNWLTEMVGVGSLDERIGIVGAKLLYRSPKHGKMVQHGGMILGVHYASLIQFKTAEELGPLYANQVYRNCSAISGACLLTKNTLFRDIGGFDEENLAVDLSDVDYCLRAHERGYRTIWNPSAILIHDESATRGDNQGRGATLNQAEADYFVSKWEGFLKRDSYYRLS